MALLQTITCPFLTMGLPVQAPKQTFCDHVKSEPEPPDLRPSSSVDFPGPQDPPRIPVSVGQLYGMPHGNIRVFNTLLYKNEFRNPQF
jgi:hypothetical protein